MDFSPDKKIAGLLAPLFALRSQNDLGVGDLGALRELIDWAADHGFCVLQLLPVNETGNDNSPYNAISSVALEPSTLEVTPSAIPELTQRDVDDAVAGFDRAVLDAGPVVYPVVKPLKRRLLRIAFDRFQKDAARMDSERARAFRAFCAAEASWLDGYALFRLLMDRNEGGERWDLWPEAQQTAQLARTWLASQTAEVRAECGGEMTFVSWIQWIAYEQWREVGAFARSRGVALMGDVPFGVSYYSADVFTDPEIFDHRWSGGAPPEPLFKDDPFTVKWGQNWGVPLYRWDILQARDLDWWRQRVRKVREIFDLFRIDHVLGFYRIYGFPWRPQRNSEFLSLSVEEVAEKTGGEIPRFHECDDESHQGREANRVNGEKLLRALLEETGAYRLVGEDLGTVPPYVRPSLTALGIPGFKIPVWEQDWNTHLIDGARYDALSVATFATHDHEPLRAMWERWMDVIATTDAGDPEQVRVRDWVWWETRRLAAWAGFDVPAVTPFSDVVHEALLRGLFATNSWLAMVMITDLLGTSQRFNVPGAVSESNWSQRLAAPVGAWNEDPDMASKLERIAAILIQTRRAQAAAGPE